MGKEIKVKSPDPFGSGAFLALPLSAIILDEAKAIIDRVVTVGVGKAVIEPFRFGQVESVFVAAHHLVVHRRMPAVLNDEQQELVIGQHHRCMATELR